MSEIITADGIATGLNADCTCISLDHEALAEALSTDLGSPGLAAAVLERMPMAFAAQPVFVPAAAATRMAEVVAAIESVVALPAFQADALAQAPAVAGVGAGGPAGVLFGYDFHLAPGGPALIEINTNAGGAMLNAVLARAQRACCAEVEGWLPGLAVIEGFEEALVAMFREEWHRAGRPGSPARMAIVDADPKSQYLYPEFLLFQRLFERHGLPTVIADPSDLEWRDGVLCCRGDVIDLVYNRLTDFYLDAPVHAALRAAWMAGAIVLTPHPRAHALHADKRLLAGFGDEERLAAWGVPAGVRALLRAHVPRTEAVVAAAAERLWAARAGLFFKPAAGYGSRAAYRGDKLTRRVWNEIVASGDYVAQALVRPGERRVARGSAAEDFKYDVRAYAYGGRVLWLAARLYQGQTTNFRTPGGGFAPVYVAPG